MHSPLSYFLSVQTRSSSSRLRWTPIYALRDLLLRRAGSRGDGDAGRGIGLGVSCESSLLVITLICFSLVLALLFVLGFNLIRPINLVFKYLFIRLRTDLYIFPFSCLERFGTIHQYLRQTL